MPRGVDFRRAQADLPAGATPRVFEVDDDLGVVVLAVRDMGRTGTAAARRSRPPNNVSKKSLPP
jgi:hypothetical protein